MTEVWPMGTHRNDVGEIVVGEVSVAELAHSYGTPLYVYDETTLRSAMRGWQDALSSRLPHSRAVYAGKAFLCTAIAEIVAEEGLGLDCVSDGELFVGLNAGVPPHLLSLHGNNKGRNELEMALEAKIGKIIVDNFNEIDLLEELTAEHDEPMTVLLRLNPGVDVHTHRKISTGVADSKFGLPISDGQAERAVAKLVNIPGVRLAGYHAHVGSQLFDTDAHTGAISDMLAFAAKMRVSYGVELEIFSPGGGFGISYLDQDTPLDPAHWIETIASTIEAGCAENGLPLPMVIIEPGRAIAGPAGIAVYTLGARKQLDGIRTYVSVDGGMADNIRPALYDARYTAEIANRDGSGGPHETVTIAGKYCESGDLLIEDIDLPVSHEGDLLAIPAAGAYCLAMASNYNMSLKPAVALVNNGSTRLIRRRESFADLIRLDITRAHQE
ncbi:MAG: diaminopimelate decarboxylase [Thermomicrobiales bacterium]|nr:diaminopimelate decarboxylase [Thermomicrobiales bacterium]